VQTWPALRAFLTAETFAAATGSTSSQTITGAWPPSSISTGFMWREASSVRCLPTAVEPVKAISRVCACGIR